MSIQKLFILCAIILVTAGCFSEDNTPTVESDESATQGYKDSLDKAKSVEQSMMEADKARKELIEENN
jgi:hypothetical protein